MSSFASPNTSTTTTPPASHGSSMMWWDAQPPNTFVFSQPFSSNAGTGGLKVFVNTEERSTQAPTFQMDECEVVFDADSGQPDVSASQAVKEGKKLRCTVKFVPPTVAVRVPPGTQDGDVVTVALADDPNDTVSYTASASDAGKTVMVPLKGNDTYGMMIDYFRAIDDAVVDAALANASEWFPKKFRTKTPTREDILGLYNSLVKDSDYGTQVRIKFPTAENGTTIKPTVFRKFEGPMTEPAPTTYESVTKSSTIIPIVKIPGVWIMSSGQFGADLFATKVLVKEAPTPASDQPFILNDDGTAPAKRRKMVNA